MLSQTKFRETIYLLRRCSLATMLSRYCVVMWVVFSVFWWSNPSAKPIDLTTIYATSAEFGLLTQSTTSHEPGRHEPTSSQAQMLFFYSVIVSFMAKEKQ